MSVGRFGSRKKYCSESHWSGLSFTSATSVAIQSLRFFATERSLPVQRPRVDGASVARSRATPVPGTCCGEVVTSRGMRRAAPWGDFRSAVECRVRQVTYARVELPRRYESASPDVAHAL